MVTEGPEKEVDDWLLENETNLSLPRGRDGGTMANLVVDITCPRKPTLTSSGQNGTQTVPQTLVQDKSIPSDIC